MTEEEWLASRDVGELLEQASEPSARKLRLLAVACARQVWRWLVHEGSRSAVEMSERSADDAVPDRILDLASAEAEYLYESLLDLAPGDPRINAAHVASYASSPDMSAVLVEDVANGLDLAPMLFRDVFGNPFRPVAVDSRWLTADVASLARAAYEERSLPSGELDPVRLGILADALEDAGCDHADLVEHLRSPGPHVRGCWALDLILGKR